MMIVGYDPNILGHFTAITKEPHFLTISLWDSLESIKRFAGDDYERARYYAEDEKFLLEFEPTVQHYEYYANTSGGIRFLAGP